MTDVPLLFDKSLQKLRVLFKYSGMNLNNEIKTPLDILKQRWLYAFNFLWVISATVASFYVIIVGAAQGKKFIELTSVGPCLTFTILAIFKSFFHFINESEIIELINSMRKLEKKCSQRKTSAEKEEIIKADTSFLNTVINVLYFLNCSMIVVFDAIPLVLIAVKYVKTNEFEMLLPYLDVFLFIPYEFKYWPFAFVHQIWSECIVLLVMAAADYLFFTCCTFIKMQFNMLKHDLEIIIPEVSLNSAKVIVDFKAQRERFWAEFIELVKWHQDLIASSNRLEIIYSRSNLFNFLLSSLVICLTGFNVTMVDDVIVVVTFITFLFMGLMQVFFLCFFADMLMTASMEVGNAIYNCQWYLAEYRVGKEILLIQTRAQKPCKVTASGFADVNLRAFMKVLSTSWSYFALLRTMYRVEYNQ